MQAKALEARQVYDGAVMPDIGERSTKVLAERQANGSADVGGMQGKYAVYPAYRAHSVRRPLRTSARLLAVRVAVGG